MKFIGLTPGQPLTARIIYDGLGNHHIEITLHACQLRETIENEARAVGYVDGFCAAYKNMGVEIKILSSDEDADSVPQVLSQDDLDTLLAWPDKTSDPVIGESTVTIEEALTIAEKITSRSPVTLSMEEAAFLNVLLKLPRDQELSQKQTDLLLAATKKFLSA